MEFVSEHFGIICYQPDQVVTFPEGLPAFEEEREFLLIEQSSTAPVVFLQSLRRPGLAFITLPAGFVAPPFQLAASPEDLEALGLPAGSLPIPGPDLLCLAIVTVAEARPPTANLMAPVVVNMRNRLARQVIMCDSRYSHQHPLVLPSGETPCS